MPIKDGGFDRTLHLDRYPQHHLNSPNVLLPSLPAFALHLFQMLCSAMHPRGRLQTSFSLGPFSLLSSGPKQNPGAGQHRRRGRNRHGAGSLTGTPCETMQPTFDKLTHGLAGSGSRRSRGLPSSRAKSVPGCPQFLCQSPYLSSNASILETMVRDGCSVGLCDARGVSWPKMIRPWKFGSLGSLF